MINLLPQSIEAEIKIYYTTGDIDKNTPISNIEGTDFFTDTIEKALINNEIDIAVHSAKDLPDKIPEELVIVGITESIDPYDVLVVRAELNYRSLKELPWGAKIATSSKRRKEQLKKFREDFQILDIRGNIEERIYKLDTSSDLDAIVIAAAGLLRLGLEHRITERIPFDILKPHPLQGSLAIEARRDNYKIIELFSNLEHFKSKI